MHELKAVTENISCMSQRPFTWTKQSLDGGIHLYSVEGVINGNFTGGHPFFCPFLPLKRGFDHVPVHVDQGLVS